jgi:two-component system, cell cycle sensor histidine kinase and response regulator CckA
MEERLQIEQVKQFARVAPLAIMATAINAPILAFIVRDQVPASGLLAWLLAALLVIAVRLPLFHRGALAADDPVRARRLGHWFVAASGLAGLLWGAAGLYFFPFLEREYQVFLAFVLGGMVAGATGAYAVLMPAFLAFTLPATLPIMSRFFLLSGEMETAMGGLLLIYLLLMIPIAWRINTTMRGSFRLRHENDELLAHQAAAWQKTEKINQELQQEIAEHRKTEQALRESRAELEQRVTARTRELAEANRKMQVDIDERRKAEQALRETNELLERVFSTSFLKIAYLDRKFNFIRVNQAYAAADNKNPQEFIGKNHFELYPDPENEKLFRQVAATGRKYSFRAKPFVRPSRPEQGVTHWDWELIPLAGEKGEGQGLALFLVDVTERIRAEEHLRQAQKMEAVGTLAGGIAHDFNNILNAILGYTELAQRDLPPDSPAGGKLAKVVTAVRRAADLVHQILTFSSVSAQERNPLMLQPEIEEAARLLEAILPENVTLRTDIDPGCRPVLANSSQIHQLLMNLGVNAAHAVREKGGAILLSLAEIDATASGVEDPELPAGSYARIRVADSGPGMDRTTRARIFDPYFTTKGQGEGSGMGLAIVHGIVKSHRGFILVRSAPGQGSCFEVLLPVLEVARPGNEKDRFTGSTGRVLFVDDEQMLVQIGREMLEQIGCQVVTAANGLEALEVFRQQAATIDLVITDQNMPGLTGAELSRRLLEIRADLPIILITGFGELFDQRQARAAGVREFIKKPFSLAELAAPVRLLLEGGRRDLEK